MPTRQDLLNACHKTLADTSLLPKDGVTYCNIGVYNILQQLGLHGQFWNTQHNRIMLANEMEVVCRLNKIKISELVAKNHSLLGRPCIAIRAADGHGHCCIVYPSETSVLSSKWSRYCPFVANIGKENAVMSSNYAFRDIPDYYVL